MIVSRSCSWCHEMNPAIERYCRSCGHEAHVARLDCQCPRCATARRRAAATAPPVPLGGVIAEALAALRRDESRPSPNPEVNVSRKRKAVTAPDPAPVPRDPPRTPVRAKLAGIIRALDDCLMETYGPHAAFAYHLWIGDGLAAASNSTFGYVPPIVRPEEGRPEPTGDGRPASGEGGDAK